MALTLRAACGLTTAQIASAFLSSEATIAQRIVRAKRRIAANAIPFRVPAPEHLAVRLDEVFAVLYLLFNEGYLASDSAERPDRRARPARAAPHLTPGSNPVWRGRAAVVPSAAMLLCG